MSCPRLSSRPTVEWLFRNVEIDSEDPAKTKGSKKRLLAALLALAVAMQTRHHADHRGGRASTNYGGRTADGFCGLGRWRCDVAKLAQLQVCWASTGWAGRFIEEVRFEKNAPLEILFGARRPALPEPAGRPREGRIALSSQMYTCEATPERM